jgi:hypothetical protein
MQELDLYRFLHETAEAEMRWYGDQLSCWISHWHIKEFCDLVGPGVLDEGGIECRLLNRGDIWLDLVPICEYHGIDPERILSKDSGN